MKVRELIDSLISHNETIALWVNVKGEYKTSLYRGLGYSIPEKYLDYKVISIFGTIPETITKADTINIEIESHISKVNCTYTFEDLTTSEFRIYPDNILYRGILSSNNNFIYTEPKSVDSCRDIEDVFGTILEITRNFKTGEVTISFELHPIYYELIDKLETFKLCTCSSGSTNWEENECKYIVDDTRNDFYFHYLYVSDKFSGLKGYWKNIEVIYDGE